MGKPESKAKPKTVKFRQVLSLLIEHGGMTLEQIREITKQTPTALWTMTHKLEKSKFVKRNGDVKYVLTITGDGIEAINGRNYTTSTLPDPLSVGAVTSVFAMHKKVKAPKTKSHQYATVWRGGPYGQGAQA